MGTQKKVMLCIIGLVGAQSWMPIVGLLSDLYREGTFTLGGLAPLLLSYLGTCALVGIFFAHFRVKSTPTKGTYGALAGAIFTCLGAALLLLFEATMSFEKVALLFALAGSLLGAGSCLLVLHWINALRHLSGRLQFIGTLIAVLCCCGLTMFAQYVGACSLILVLTMVLSALSAGCFGLLAKGNESPEAQSFLQGLRSAHARIAVSFSCVGLVFAMMIMQFMIAPHGQASPLTWIFGFIGIAAAMVFLAGGKAIRKTNDFFFAYRLTAIPILVAFFPFDPGSDFSLKFALCFSTMALWSFFAIAPGVIRDAAAILKAPVYYVAGIGIGGLCFGGFLGYLVAWIVEVINPTPNFYINISAIVAMALGLIASNLVVTRGSLARAFRKVTVLSPDTDETTSTMPDQVAMVVESFGLTSRESDVLLILARGHGLSRVQEDLYISEGTAITHRRHIYQKLNVHSKSELIDLVTHFGVSDYEDD